MLATKTRVRDDRVFFFAHDAFAEFVVTIFFVMNVNTFFTSKICDRTLLNVMFIISAVEALPKLTIA